MFFRLLAALIISASVIAIILMQLLPISISQLPSPWYGHSPNRQAEAPAEVRLNDVTLRWQVLPQHQQTTKALSAITENTG